MDRAHPLARIACASFVAAIVVIVVVGRTPAMSGARQNSYLPPSFPEYRQTPDRGCFGRVLYYTLPSGIEHDSMTDLLDRHHGDLPDIAGPLVVAFSVRDGLMSVCHDPLAVNMVLILIAAGAIVLAGKTISFVCRQVVCLVREVYSRAISTCHLVAAWYDDRCQADFERRYERMLESQTDYGDPLPDLHEIEREQKKIKLKLADLSLTRSDSTRSQLYAALERELFKRKLIRRDSTGRIVPGAGDIRSSRHERDAVSLYFSTERQRQTGRDQIEACVHVADLFHRVTNRLRDVPYPPPTHESKPETRDPLSESWADLRDLQQFEEDEARRLAEEHSSA